MRSIRFNQFLSGRNVGQTMHSAVSVAFIGTLVAGAAMIAGSELPDLGGGSSNPSFAYSVNDKGDAVGRSYNANYQEHATAWVGATTIDLGSLGGTNSDAKAVSLAGVIVGSSDVAGDMKRHAALWSSATSAPIDLGTLGGWNSSASGVNANGDVVGLSHIADNSEMHATLWSGAGHATVDLHPAGAGFSEAVAINTAGDVVGSSMDAVTWASQALLWTGPSHALAVLPTLGGVNANAYAINDKGDVVGQSQNSSGIWRPTLWAAPSHAAVDLGTPIVGTFGSATGISSVGDVVGYTSTVDGSKHATLWQMASAGGVPSTCKLSTSLRSQDRSRSDNRSSRSEERRRAEERDRDREWLGLAPATPKRSSAAASAPASLAPSSSTGSRTMVDLGVLAGPNSQAQSVNASGKIVGFGDNAGTLSRAMTWQATPSAPVPPTGTPGRDHEGNHENRGQEDNDC